MSYQFEDDSALEELLNQQLDRRKQQQTSSSKQSRLSNRPTTASLATGGPSTGLPVSGSTVSFAFRPATASQLYGQQPTSRQLEGDDELSSSLPSTSGAEGGGAARPKAKSSLASWLQGAGGSTTTSIGRRIGEKVNEPKVKQFGEQQQQVTTANLPSADGRLPPRGLDGAEPICGANDDLNELLSPSSLRDMSKQRLIQVILEVVKPRLEELKGLANEQAERETEKLRREIQLERNRLEIIELRHEELLDLERHKWQQANQQLESRLASGDAQMGKLFEDQRNHLAQLNDQYHKQLTRMSELFDERLQQERARFETALKQRDEMHKLELEGKLNVDCNLMKLDTVQLEWRRTLETTINQLNEQYKSVETLLEKQTILVNGTQTDLAAKTKQLCDQYDNYDQCQRIMANLARELQELMPRLVQEELRAGSVLDNADQKLSKLNERLDTLVGEHKQLAKVRMELGEEQNKINEGKLKFALDAARLSMKEERLDELLNRNSTSELKLSNDRKSLDELQAQMQSKRMALDERFADLKEQNYALHLLRKRLTAQKEELIKAQIEFAEERKLFKSNKLQADDELKRLDTLRVRVQRELDQLRRLQRSLVCSLCMSRLFDNGTNEAPIETMQFASHQMGQQFLLSPQQIPLDGRELLSQLNLQHFSDEQLGEGLPNRRFGVTLKRVDGDEQLDRRQTHPRDREGNRLAERESNNHRNDQDQDIALQLKRTELNTSQIAAENEYIERLVGTELL